jgi:hypothetical protein
MFAQPTVHDVGIDAMGQGDPGHRGASLPALLYDLSFEFRAVVSSQRAGFFARHRVHDLHHAHYPFASTIDQYDLAGRLPLTSTHPSPTTGLSYRNEWVGNIKAGQIYGLARQQEAGQISQALTLRYCSHEWEYCEFGDRYSIAACNCDFQLGAKPMSEHAGTVAIALIAAIWARESARSEGFVRINNIRDCIILGRSEGEPLSPTHRQLMYASDWRSQAIGVTTVTFLFAFVVAAIPFLYSDCLRALASVCWPVAGYQICSGILTGWTFFQDSSHLRKVIAELPN